MQADTATSTMAGTTVDALLTPAPLVDLDRLERNIARLAQYTAQHRLALRPHVKTHKSSRIGGAQIQHGAVGLTCATPRELDVMSTVAKDLLLAHPPVGDPKVRRVLQLTTDVRLTVALDSPEAVASVGAAAAAADRPVDVYVEIDVGMHRVGLTSIAAALDVARAVAVRPPLAFAGIAFYPGHVRDVTTEHEAKRERLSEQLREVIEAFDAAGLHPRVVSGGSTPMAWHSHEIFGLTEIRPGTYAYNDRTTADIGACQWDDCAFSVLATVVSTAVPGQAVIDAGQKALGREPLRAGTGHGTSDGFGALLERSDVVVRSLSEEHGILDLSDTSWRPSIGEQVRVVPNHVCAAVHLYDFIHGVRGDEIETGWPVDARGR